MKQLGYEDICLLIGRLVLESETKLKAIFEELQIAKRENEELKSGSNSGPQTGQ